MVPLPYLFFVDMVVCLLLIFSYRVCKSHVMVGKQGLSKWFLVSEVKESVTYLHDYICQRVNTELTMGDHRVWTKTSAKKLSDQMVVHQTQNGGSAPRAL